jgi:hypothetical protein
MALDGVSVSWSEAIRLRSSTASRTPMTANTSGTTRLADAVLDSGRGYEYAGSLPARVLLKLDAFDTPILSTATSRLALRRPRSTAKSR